MFISTIIINLIINLISW